MKIILGLICLLSVLVLVTYTDHLATQAERPATVLVRR